MNIIFWYIKCYQATISPNWGILKIKILKRIKYMKVLCTLEERCPIYYQEQY